MSTAVITETDVVGFQDKLEEWGATLSVGEQAVLRMVMVRAFPPGSVPEPEVEGFSRRDPASGLPTGKRMHKPFTVTAPFAQGLPSFLGSPYLPLPDPDPEAQ